MIPCILVDSAVAYRVTIDSIAYDLGVALGKCLWREDQLIEDAEVVADSASIARDKERKESDEAVAFWQDEKKKSDKRTDKARGRANVTTVALVVTLLLLILKGSGA